jgi:hypothetical protein
MRLSFGLDNNSIFWMRSKKTNGKGTARSSPHSPKKTVYSERLMCPHLDRLLGQPALLVVQLSGILR